MKSGFQAAQYEVTMITNSIDAPEPLHTLTSSQLSSWLSHKHYEVSLWKTLASSAVIVSPNHSMTAYIWWAYWGQVRCFGRFGAMLSAWQPFLADIQLVKLHLTSADRELAFKWCNLHGSCKWWWWVIQVVHRWITYLILNVWKRDKRHDSLFYKLIAYSGARLFKQNKVQDISNIGTNTIGLTAALSLACLKIRSRNEEAINSTQNRIYSLKVFHFLLLDIYFLFVSELI